MILGKIIPRPYVEPGAVTEEISAFHAALGASASTYHGPTIKTLAGLARGTYNGSGHKGTLDGTKATKAAFTKFDPPDPTDVLTDTQVLQRLWSLLPGKQFMAHGAMKSGLAVACADEPGTMAVVKARKYLALAHGSLPLYPDGETFDLSHFEFGREQTLAELEITMTRYKQPRIRAKLQAAWDLLNTEGTHIGDLNDPRIHASSPVCGVTQAGKEREMQVLNPDTGDFRPILDDELLQGTVERLDGLKRDGNEKGIYATPQAALIGTCSARLAFEKRFGNGKGYLLIDAGTPPCGSPLNTLLNTTKSHPKNSGAYVAPLSHGYTKVFWPRTRHSWLLREKQALTLWNLVKNTPLRPEVPFVNEANGEVNMRGFLDYVGDNRLWAAHAGHISVDIGNVLNVIHGRYEADIEMAVNQANLFASFGVLARLLTSSGPWIQEEIATDEDGNPLYDARTPIRNDMNSANSMDEPIDGPEGLVRNMIEAITKGKADRLARSCAVHIERSTNETGEETITVEPLQHGDIRIRIEMVNNGSEASARIEYTGAGASTSLQSARTMAILQMLSVIALDATVQGKDALELVAEKLGITKQEAWIIANDVGEEFNTMGPKSPKAQLVIERMRRLVEMYDVPAMREVREVALGALDSLNYDGTFDELAMGRGTLGSATRHLALLKNDDGTQIYNGLQIAHIIHAFEHQEAAFVTKNKNHPEILADFFAGRGGFQFEWPDVSAYSKSYAERVDGDLLHQDEGYDVLGDDDAHDDADEAAAHLSLPPTGS